MKGAELQLKRVNTAFDSYEAQLTAQARAMAEDGVGDPHSAQAQLDALRLLREAIKP